MEIFRKIGALFLDFIEIVVIALAMFVVMYIFLFQPHQVKGNSMFPNFYDGEYLLTDKISYRLNQPKQGEVIIFKAPKNEDYDYIKRIIGLPGDAIRISNGKVYLNSKLLKEAYLPPGLETAAGDFWQEGKSLTIPANNFFVMGDNRAHSSDARDWGPVPKENIIGKAWFRYWPPNQIGLIPQAEY